MKKRFWGALGLTTLAVMSLAACSGNKEKESAGADVKQDMTPYGKYEDTVEFTVGRPKYNGTDLPEGQTTEDNASTTFTKDQVNTNVKFAWEAQDNTQKNAMAISSGDIPDVMLVNREQFKQLAENDMIADMTDVYNETVSPLMKETYDTFEGKIIDQVTIDGKIMAIPSTMLTGEHSIMWIREDWLEKVGAELPQTKDDVYELAKSFVEQDFAGDGKTVGFAMNSKITGQYGQLYTLDPLFGVNHSYPRQWIEVDGKQAYGTIQPETKEALAELAQLYKDGVIDQQFAVRKSEDLTNLVANGQLGIVFSPWWAPYGDLQKAIANDPNADWVPVAAPLDDEGKFNVPVNDPVNTFVVVDKDYAHPEAIMKAINVAQDFKLQDTPESIEWLKKEAPDTKKSWDHQLAQIPVLFDYNDSALRVHNELVAGVEANSSENVSESQKATFDNYMKEQENPKADLVVWGDVMSRFDGTEVAFSDVTNKIDVDFFGQTKSMKTSWVNLEKLEDEMLVKIISGEEPVDYFDEFVKQWKSMGGEDITKEVNEEVASMK